MDVGTPGVRVSLIKSLRAESESSPSGVTGQLQQEISCSSGENVYTFKQMFPFCVGNAVVELVPVSVTLTTESPMGKLDAERTWNGFPIKMLAEAAAPGSASVDVTLE